MVSFIIGIDVGGTFTDVVVVDGRTGGVTVAKSQTTPRDLIEGVFDCLRLAADELGLSLTELLGQTTKFAHGTTQTTNAVFTRSGAKVGLVTTSGFADQILIMRGKGRVAGIGLAERKHLRTTDKPEPLVPRTRIREVAERVDWEGAVVVPLESNGWREIVDKLVEAEGVDALAVALLWAFKNPAHEQAIRDYAATAHPELYVSASSDVAPVMGEYERTATTVLNAYVGPVYVRYVERLEARLREEGLRCPLLVIHCSGGVGHPADTAPILTVESGPAAGVVGAKFVARELGYDNVIATDVGGTTFKVSVISQGDYSYAYETILEQYSLRVPMIDVVSIGAGGGSIAWIDRGRLRVGPQSAGADPGPACYGRGGEEPTVTDADVVLGFIDPDYFLGGRLPLRADLAEEAMRRIADPLFDGDVVAAASGVKELMDARMADLIRRTLIERGHDPRDFVLMAYGGAGPTHCGAYSRELGLRAIVIPASATVHSAYGAAASDLRHTFQTTDLHVAPADPASVAKVYEALERRGRELLTGAGLSEEAIDLERWAELRYRRQTHEVRVSVSGGPVDQATLEEAIRRFEEMYAQLYGSQAAYREAGIEFVTFGVEAVGRTAKPELVAGTADGGGADAALRGERSVFWREEGGFSLTPIYDGVRLGPDSLVEGPAVIEHPGTTIVVHPGQAARVDGFLNTVIEQRGDDA